MIKSIHTVRAAFFASAAVALSTAASDANAAVTFNISQVGSNVVATASGTFDSTGATVITNSSFFFKGVRGISGYLGVGTTVTATAYRMVNVGAIAFGTSTSFIGSTSETGLNLGFHRNTGGNYFFISNSYVNNAEISATSTFSNSTLGSLGLTAGTYLSSVAGNVITVNIGQSVAAVPEPATWAMMLVGFSMIAATARYRRRSVAITYA
jgi:hypothetical protein